MGGNKIVIIILVLTIAGTALIGSIASGPKTPTPSGSNTPINSPTFSKDYNLPSLLGLAIWATATPPPLTGTPVPPNLTKIPPTPTGIIPTTTGPSPTPNVPSGACSWMDNSLPNVTEFYPNGSTSMPATTREVCAWNASQYYSLPFRNANCQASQKGIDRAYETMKRYYPAYFSNNRLLQDWKTVQQYSIKYNFNPLFVIAQWIEESAASGATQATKLGCDYRRNRDGSRPKMAASSTICEQMECLFGLQSVYPGNYALYACNYRHGGDHWKGTYCDLPIGFTKGVEFWYNEIGIDSNLSSECRIKFFSGAHSGCPNL